MRFVPLLLGLSLAVAHAVPSSTVAPVTSTSKPKSGTTTNKVKVAPIAPEKSTSTTKQPSQSTRQSKALKSAPGENRGKRTLYDFGNAGYLYANVANRRAGYADNSGSYYPHAGYYNGQNALAQFPGGYAPYPQYLEAPEPIIEIIIKDANETLSEAPAQTLITKKKKKKEKVHVFYVNYKKDQNNKLHLESPIASLNNDDNEEEEEEEEEEVVQYPVTPLPPLKTTTLRTIIHPDSEKYHSNSGIHVSFGAEDNRQTGHILEEHDAESIQRQVVALPVGPGIKTENFVANTRADYARDNSFGRGPGANLLFGSSQGGYHQQQPSNLHYQSQQQLPLQHGSNYFRAPAALVGSPPPTQPQLSKQHFYSKPQPERPNFTQQQLPSTSSQTIFNKLIQQSQYYINHNQQYQPQHPQQQQSQTQPQAPQQQYFKTPTSVPSKQQVPFFPTIPPKSQSPAQYQPVKFRPTPAVQSKPVSLKLENVNYQQQQQQQHQQQPLYQSSKPVSNQYQYNRQPQYVQQPQFNLRLPTPTPNYYAQESQSQSQRQQSHSLNSNKDVQSGLSSLHSYFDIKPSKETELLKSIPKYEQHITETLHNPIVQQHSSQVNQQSQQSQQFSYSNTRNEVIHDIPAPNLGPTQQSQSLSGHYITASNNQQQSHQPQQSQSAQQSQQYQYNSYVSDSQPAVYAESTHGQKVMVVTPMPPSATYSDFNLYTQQASQQSVVQVQPQSSSLQAQASNHYVQEPRKPASSQINAAAAPDNSPFSVSTYHSDVFKELEQRQQEQSQQQQQQQQRQQEQSPQPQQQPQNSYVPATAATKTEAEATPSAVPNGKASQTLLQLPDEVPDDLRQQLFSSGILNNADISVLDYDKVGDIALENLPAEHLQHFYGAGGGAQIAETNKVLSVVKPNGEKVSLSEKEIDRVKQRNSLPQKQNLDVKVVRFDAQQEQSVSEKYLKADATVVTPVDLSDKHNRYLPLKINGAQFPIPDSEELLGKKIVSVVVLAPVEAQAQSGEARSLDTKEVKFLGGELIKTLVKKPTKDNFKRWLEKEARTDLEQQSVVLLVAKSSDQSEQEIFMYDISTTSVNKLNGELSRTFVSVAEENASSEDLEHAATLDHSSLESMMHRRRR